MRWHPEAAVQAHDAQIATSGITTVFDAIRVGVDEDTNLTADDMRMLTSRLKREGAYFGALRKWDLSAWSNLRALHNRQVQLALAKRRVAGESDGEDEDRSASLREVQQLRAAIVRVLEIEFEAGAALKGPFIGHDSAHGQVG